MSYCLLITSFTMENRLSKKIVGSSPLVFEIELVQVLPLFQEFVCFCLCSFVWLDFSLCVFCIHNIDVCAYLEDMFSLGTSWTWGHGAAAASLLLGYQIQQLLAQMSDLFKFTIELFIIPQS